MFTCMGRRMRYPAFRGHDPSVHSPDNAVFRRGSSNVRKTSLDSSAAPLLANCSITGIWVECRNLNFKDREAFCREWGTRLAGQLVLQVCKVQEGHREEHQRTNVPL
jgi:hypothetical protein